MALVFREMDVGLYCLMMPCSAHILFTLRRVLAAKASFLLSPSLHPLPVLFLSSSLLSLSPPSLSVLSPPPALLILSIS